MQIYFADRKIELTEDDKLFMIRRLEGLEKFFKGAEPKFFVTIEKDYGNLHGEDLYRASLKIVDGTQNYFSEDKGEDVRKAFDEAYRDLFRIVRKDRARAQALMRSAGRFVKSIIRGKRRK